MNKLNDFMNKRKKDKRRSLIIDNFNYQYKDFEETNNIKRNEAITRRKSLDLIENFQDGTESLSEYGKDTKDYKYMIEEHLKIKEDINDTKDKNFYLNSIVNKNIKKFDKLKHPQKFNSVNHDCYKCKNGKNKTDPFMILNCGHIFHIGCLVEIHFSEFTNSGGIIDEKFISKCKCVLCGEQMEVEDILHMHNKFTKCTKEQLIFQTDQIDILDNKISKLKDEMRIQLEYKQRLEDKRNKSKQITITLNNLL